MNEQAVANQRNPHSGSAFQAIRAIDYTVIFVRHMAAMRRFYEGILGFPLLRELSPGWIEYRVGGKHLGLGQAKSDCSGCSNAPRQRLASAGIQGFRSRSRSVRRRTRAAGRQSALTAH